MPFSRFISVARTILFDLRYGQILSGSVGSRFADTGANFTANTRYDELSEIFKGRVMADDVLVDIGCGKGRVLNYWLANFSKQKLYGLELDPDIAETARVRLKAYPNITVLAGDAILNTPADGTLFYLFNPFTELPMQKFRKRIKDLFYSPETQSWIRAIRIFYLNPTQEHIFRQDPDFVVNEIEIKSSPHRFVVISTRS